MISSEHEIPTAVLLLWSRVQEAGCSFVWPRQETVSKTLANTDPYSALHEDEESLHYR